jgi:predicted hotdog family 3-hydroxylacyl-ACP dehydratase
MPGPVRIRDLIPHQGAMCLLDEVVSWAQDAIVCRARSHLAADNPLRRAGRLGAVCGIEYGLQAAALHGALTAGGGRQAPGYLASLREVAIEVDRLDDPAIGVLAVQASLILREASGLIYLFRLRAEDGRALLSGRATIALPGGPEFS